MKRYLTLLGIVALGGVLLLSLRGRPAPAPPAGAPFRVAVFGDMPYEPAGDPEYASEHAAYRSLLDTIDALDVAFAVHLGDITSANCSDSLFAQRLQEFQRVAHALVYTPGDNEWTDCPRDRYDPLERLARLRELFASGPTSLGRKPLPLRRQSEDAGFGGFPENARWRRDDVLFVTVHAVGSNNNWGPEATPGAEYVARNAAGIAWLREAFALAGRERLRGVAVFMQANPRLEGWMARLEPLATDGFAELRAELQRLGAAFGGPVALVHGDTHYFRVDKPFADRATRRTYLNITRAETFGTPDIHGLVMTVDPSDPNLFRFEPLLVPASVHR